jgi:hypothetical protein
MYDGCVEVGKYFATSGPGDDGNPVADIETWLAQVFAATPDDLQRVRTAQLSADDKATFPNSSRGEI